MNIFKRKQTAVPARRQRQQHSDTPISSDRFRLGRTLTGSMSNRVTSAAEHTDNSLVSPRVQSHDLVVKRRKLSLLLIAAITGIGLFGWLLGQFTVKAEFVVAGGPPQRAIAEKSYQDTLQKYFFDRPFERFAFARNTASLGRYIASAHPEIKDVGYSGLSGFGTGLYSLTIRRAVAGWDSGGKHYYVDGEGVAYENNYYAKPDVSIVDNTGVTTPEGSVAVASNRLLSFVGQSVKYAKSYGYTVSKVVLPPNTTRQLQVSLKGSDVTIKCSVDHGAGQQMYDMARGLNYLKSRGKTAEYVDVRVQGKVFYR